MAIENLWFRAISLILIIWSVITGFAADLHADEGNNSSTIIDCGKIDEIEINQLAKAVGTEKLQVSETCVLELLRRNSALSQHEASIVAVMLRFSKIKSVEPWTHVRMAEWALDHGADSGLMYFFVAECHLSPMCPYSKGAQYAVRSLEYAAGTGHLESIFQLAMRKIFHSSDESVLQDAFELLATAARHGHVGAMVNLGAMYGNGDGVDKDESAAAEWYQRAFEKGSAQAAHSLGMMKIRHGMQNKINEEVAKGMAMVAMAADTRYPSAVGVRDKFWNHPEVNMKPIIAEKERLIQIYGNLSIYVSHPIWDFK